ncbi:BatD family protein [Vibrio maritimus]|uniref:BatD family protein n=1 Tax=Vibrio maritimus TaxID=990268 RepID=UPI004067A680
MKSVNFRLAITKLQLIFLAALLSMSMSAHADMTINQLQREGGVEIKSWLSKGDSAAEPAAIREQVILYIEVATPRWFTGGTRISGFGMPDLIVKQRNQLATNYTERKNGQTWSRQRWEITLYPQQSGEYRLPKVPVRVQVSAQDGSSVSGTLYTEPMSLFTYLPDASFTQDEPWFSAQDVNVNESWKASSEDLKAGDSLVRTLNIEAADTLSILLPPLGEPSVEGVKGYPKPSVLSDSQTRGVYKSKRTDEVTYILTTGGEVTFPEQEVRWWDVESQSVKSVTLAAKKVQVAHTWRSLINTYKTELVILFVTMLAIVTTFKLMYRFYKTHPTPKWWQLAKAVRRREWALVRAVIYKKGREVSGEVELKKIHDEPSWQQASHSIQNETPDAALSRRMWKRLKPKRRSERSSVLKGLDKWH